MNEVSVNKYSKYSSQAKCASSDGRFGQKRCRPHSLLDDGFLTHPHSKTEDSRSPTLGVDERIHPRRDFDNAHQLQISIGLYEGYPQYAHFDGRAGHMGAGEAKVL